MNERTSGNPLEDQSIAVAVVSYKRPEVISQTLQILRITYPNLSIYVADQNGHQENQDLYKSCGAIVFWLDYDVGLSASRNWLFTQIREKYILLIDDDDVPLPQSDEAFLLTLARILEKEPDWLVVGGNRVGKDPFHLCLSRTEGEWNELFGKLPDGKSSQIPGSPYALIEADTVHNFALFSRERLIEWNLLWDENLKILEHEDYYLGVKKFRERTGKGRVLYCENLKAEEIPHRQTDEYRRDRVRPQMLNYVANKWNLDSFRYEVSPQKWRGVWLNQEKWVLEVFKLINNEARELRGQILESGGAKAVPATKSAGTGLNRKLELALQIGKRDLERFEKRLATSGFRFVDTDGFPPQRVTWALIAPVPPGTKWLFDPVRVLLHIDALPSRKKANPSENKSKGDRLSCLKTPRRGALGIVRSLTYRTIVLTRRNGIVPGFFAPLGRYLKSAVNR